MNTEIYFVNLRIQSEYRKIRTRNNSVFGHFSRSEDFYSFLRIWSYLLEKSLMENFLFCAVFIANWVHSLHYKSSQVYYKSGQLLQVLANITNRWTTKVNLKNGKNMYAQIQSIYHFPSLYKLVTQPFFPYYFHISQLQEFLRNIIWGKWGIRQKLDVVGYSGTEWKVSKYGVISGPYFPVFGLNTGKYGPEITPYLDTFHAVGRVVCRVDSCCLTYSRWGNWGYGM